MKPRILFVDQQAETLEQCRTALQEKRGEWAMEFRSDPLEASVLLRRTPSDIVVVDYDRDGGGAQLLEALRSDPKLQETSVVVVTDAHDDEGQRQALAAGAADLLRKPFGGPELLARVSSMVRLKACEAQLRQQNEIVDQKVREWTAQLDASRFDIICRLGRASEFRDEETGNHVLRVGCYSRVIATAIGLDARDIEMIFLSAPLHDIGKLAIPDEILRKPGRLTTEEWEIMQQHCEHGAAILQDNVKMLEVCRRWGREGSSLNAVGHGNPILETAAQIAHGHHEKWNGSGYPQQLEGEQIPIAARIVAVADVFDALRSERPYKPAYTLEKSLAILAAGAGSHFDPAVHAAFLASIDQITAIEQEFSDSLDLTLETIDDQYSLCRR